MKVSFDLDGVLFVDPKECEAEPALQFPLDRLFPDRLRRGTVGLIRALQARKDEAWVYTSSFRTETYIRALFRHYGVRFYGIISARRQEDGASGPIALYVGGAQDAADQARNHGYRAVQVTGNDPRWADRVLAEAESIRRQTAASAEHRGDACS